MRGSRSPRSRSLAPVLVAAVTLVAFLLTGPASAGTTSKPYAIDVSPHTVPAGSTLTYNATLRNETDTQQLGSANLTAPAGFSIVSASAPSPAGSTSVTTDTVQLRDLALPPGGVATLTIVAQAPCPSGTYAWSSIAKQSNDFNGSPGNDLFLDTANSDLTSTLSGTCVLGFVVSRQPSSAQVNSNITSEAFLPTGIPVQVQVLDAAGSVITNSTVPVTVSTLDNPSGGVLSGTTSSNAVAGLATFSTLSIDRGGLGYTLTATTTAPAIARGNSTAFDIFDVGKRCPASSCGSGKVAKGDTTAQMTASPGADGDLLALGVAIEGSLDCGGASYVEVSATVTFFVSGDRTKTVTIMVPKRVVSGGPNQRQVCYSSPTAFVDRTGATVTSGLLPDCRSAPAPCVLSRGLVGNMIAVTFSAPAGDPKGRI